MMVDHVCELKAIEYNRTRFAAGVTEASKLVRGLLG